MANILCYKSKTLKNGEHPLVIRICKDGKKKYQNIGVSVKAEHWDFKKNKPKSNCPKQSITAFFCIKLCNEGGSPPPRQRKKKSLLKKHWVAKSPISCMKNSVFR